MKKLIALLLAVVITAAPASAFALASTPEEAIAKAKTTFDIPDELTEFRYDVSDYGYELNWYDKDYEKSVYVMLNADLVPIQYSAYLFDEKSGLSPFRKSELQKAAEDFLKKTLPDLADNLILSQEDSSLTRFVFNRHENGIKVNDNTAYVYVSKTAGVVTDFSLNWDFESQFGGEVATDEEQAYDLLADNAVLTQYRILGGNAIPVYTALSDMYVSASDARVFKGSYYSADKQLINFSAGASADTAETVSSSEGSGGYTLTPEEISEVEKMGNLISEERVKEIVASLPELTLPEGYNLSLSYNSIKTKETTRYRVVCEFDGEADNEDDRSYARLVLDGETGELLDFYAYGGGIYVKTENPVSDRECTEGAKEFLNKIKDMSDYRLNEEAAYSNSYTFTASYVRYINDIPYPADSKTVRISKADARVVSYDENIPQAQIVTPASLTDKLTAVKSNYAVELIYAYESAENGAAEPVMAYKLTPNSSFYCLRAEDGAAITYNNEIAVPETQKQDETDHWAWNVFEILRENQIYLTGSFGFDDEITKKEFISLLAKLYRFDVIPYYYYRSASDSGEGEDSPISREAAARIVAVYMGWERIIDLDIYTTSFADEAEFGGKIGAAAILQGLNVMQGDEGGSFAPNRNLSYADAYTIIYNLTRLINADKEDEQPVEE